MSVLLNDITKSYEKKYIFKNYNLEIKDNEFVAIMGKSGSGKTTLLNIIGGIDEFESGDIFINNIENPWKNKKMKIRFLREEIGYLFQNYALIDNESIGNNLDIALKYIKLSKEEKYKKKIEVLKKVGLNYDLKMPIYKLSGGEQQRVAISRLFLKKSSIILADEPTGSLDIGNKYKILELLKELQVKHGKTVIIVSHDKEVEKFADKIINL
ncbi:putative bacteriocin export ABC transporter [Clostridium thermobutyricum]|uniref:putative bacteriocin export ABC transporter n=1 Tax=Clostridium thermobutyricum TaxID=29372 RepID=UPI0029420071|nr:putative bacteriocin export ABC transporter [Clostridium thermobutyricum]